MTTATDTPPPRTADGERIHKLTLLRGSIVLMRTMLGMPGWSKSPKSSRKGVRLLRALPKLVEPKNLDEDAKDAWAMEKVAVELPEALRKLGADCLGHFVKEGAVGATEAVDCLFTEFGVVDEE